MWSIPLSSHDIFIHNVRSLNKHCKDLTSDQLILRSKILVLQETMTISSDNFNIEGHFLIGRIDGKLELQGVAHIYTHMTHNHVNC